MCTSPSEVTHASLLNLDSMASCSHGGEMIGKTIGSVVQVADTEDDGSGSEFLRI